MHSFYADDASLSVLQPTTRRQRRGWIKRLYGGPNGVLLESVVVMKLEVWCYRHGCMFNT